MFLPPLPGPTTRLEILGDSKVAVGWMNGVWRVSSFRYRERVAEAQNLLHTACTQGLVLPRQSHFDWFRWVYRELNQLADGAANAALDAALGAAEGASGRVITILKPPHDPGLLQTAPSLFRWWPPTRSPPRGHGVGGAGRNQPAPADPTTPVWELLATCGEFRGDSSVDDAESLAAFEAVQAALAYVAGRPIS